MQKDQRLPKQKVTATLFDINGARKFIRQAAALLPADRYLKMQAYLREEDRLRSLAASLLLLKATRGCGVYYTDFGKPYTEGLSFNISHSGDYAVLAQTDAPIAVGVDIEKVETPADDLLKTALTLREHQWVSAAESEREKAERFYIVWTQKESLVKCEGGGFVAEPSEVETALANSGVVSYLEQFAKIKTFDIYTSSKI